MVEFYNKEQINALKTKFIEGELAKKISEDALALIQNSIVEHASCGEDCFEAKSLPENEIAKDKVVSTLKELGYSINDSQSKTTIKIDGNKCKLVELSDVISVDDLELYMKSPVMPAYCALAILELSKESENSEMTSMINEIVDRLIRRVNNDIAERISKHGAFATSDTVIRLSTYNDSEHWSIIDEIFANVRSIFDTPFEDLFRRICKKDIKALPLSNNGLDELTEYDEVFEIKAEYLSNDDNRQIVGNILRAPVWAELTRRLDRSGLDVKDARWNDETVEIYL